MSLLRLLSVLLIVLVVVFAAPQLDTKELSSRALRVPVRALSAGDGPQQYQCSDSNCNSLCVLLGWLGGFCLDPEWCLCYA